MHFQPPDFHRHYSIASYIQLALHNPSNNFHPRDQCTILTIHSATHVNIAGQLNLRLLLLPQFERQLGVSQMAMQAVSSAHQSAGLLHSQFNSNNEAHSYGGSRGFKLCTLQGVRTRTRTRTRSLSVIRAAVSSDNEISTPAATKIDDRSNITKADVVVIGAGIGGLCCAALLAKYGYKVVVCESHDIAGGAGHAFERQGFQFDSGPSFHAGLSIKPSINPLKQVLDAIGENVECVQYKNWIGYLPEGIFKFTADRKAYEAEIRRVGGARAASEWRELEEKMKPLAGAAVSLPAAALRPDPAVVFTAGRFLPQLWPYLSVTKDLLSPFSHIVNQVVKDPFLKRLIDLECFVLSGLLADSTITAEMATMFQERHREGGSIDYPIGGGGSIIAALVRGLEKHGGRLLLNTHVEEIVLEGGRAVGIRVRPTRGTKKNPYTIRAAKAVVSNASTWDTAKLLPRGSLPSTQSYIDRASVTEKTDSFMHLHLGIDASGLPSDLECHHFALRDWKVGVGAPQNVCIASIPTVFDPSLAPPGCHVVHAYTAGNEPYSIWKGMDRKSPEYAALKEERSQVLWQTLEKVIPDIRDRVKLKLVGTPLTHERYLRRSEGTYGPAIRAGKASFPGASSEIPGLLCCGDSTMPGIGVPAVAASGMITANSLVPVWQHWGLLNSLDVAA